MTTFDDPNRQAVGLDPIWENTGDNVPGTIAVTATLLSATVTLSGGLSDTGYDVDWGDGGTGAITTDTAGDGADSHDYTADGTYTVTVSRADGASLSEDVTVAGAAGG